MGATKYWGQQNIGSDKILVVTKYWRLKIFVPTKYWRLQNIRVDKILASTESRHRQNVGACAEASPYCFGPAESAAADFSQTSLMFLYFSLKTLISPRALTKCAVAAGRPDFMGRLSPTLYRPAMQKTSQYWRRLNIGTHQDFTYFCQTIAVNISAHKCPVKNR